MEEIMDTEDFVYAQIMLRQYCRHRLIHHSFQPSILPRPPSLLAAAPVFGETMAIEWQQFSLWRQNALRRHYKRPKIGKKPFVVCP